MAKRMLVLGNSDALWTKRFIEHIALPAGYEVVLFPTEGHEGKYDDFYAQNQVTVYHDPHTLPVIRHIPRVRMWARVWENARDLIRMGPFDVVHNHYISQRDLALGYRVARHFNARWLCCIWGSDFLRASKLELSRMKPYLEKCHGIHGDFGQLPQRVGEVYGKEMAKKTRVVDFGHVGYKCIDAVRQQADKAACKRHFGIDPSTFALCVGYSASSAQQQLLVLEQLAKLPKETLKGITLVLQQTYCLDDPDYVEQTRAFARTLPCKTVALTEFLNDMETAWLRLASDMFILAIKTDAFCATLSEYLYAGSIVVRGDWLVYQQLIDMGITLPTFHEFEEIPAMVERGLSGDLTGLPGADRARFPALYSWDAVRPEWLKLYEE